VSRTPVVTLAWCDFQARTVALAAALDGEAQFIASGTLQGWPLLPFRYARNAALSWRELGRADPTTVIVITPPVFAPLTAWLWCATHRRTLVVDCHTGAFHSRKWAWARPLHRFILRRAGLAMLHTHEAATEVERWGVRTLVVPDDVPEGREAQLPERSNRKVVVVAGSLDSNEPIAMVMEAARQLPELEIRCTGELSRLAPALRASAPANVRFTGWLSYPRFLGELVAADVVAAFSTDPEIMNRAAFEAVGLARPLVLSDLPKLRERFKDAALFSANEPGAMARTLRAAFAEMSALQERSRGLQGHLRAERDAALEHLRAAIAPVAPSARPRRVLVVSAHPYPTHPLLRRNVEHLVAEGVALDLVCMRDEKAGSVALPKGMRTFALPVKHRRARALSYMLEYAAFFLLALPIVTALSLRRRYDVVQVDNLPDFLVFTALVARLRGSRVVLYIYDLFPEMTMTRLRASREHPLVRMTQRLERWSAQFASHVITVSHCFRNLLAARGVDPSRVSVLYNTQPMPSDISHVASQRSVLITHASLLERYGIQVAIRALPYLIDCWPDLTFEVLGEGEYLSALQSLATRLAVADRVRFVGFLPWKVAMERISRASIGIVPVIADGVGELILPGKLLEYAAIGIPVVCSRLPGIEEGFPPDTLAYFPQGDAQALAAQVDRLLRDGEGAKAQSARAQEALRRIAWETVAPQYLAALGRA
jgi:glycosyltransferase involved in cell wall biosynthesis